MSWAILIILLIFTLITKYMLTDFGVGSFCSICGEGYVVINVTDWTVTVQDLFGFHTREYNKIWFKLISWPCL